MSLWETGEEILTSSETITQEVRMRDFRLQIRNTAVPHFPVVTMYMQSMKSTYSILHCTLLTVNPDVFQGWFEGSLFEPPSCDPRNLPLLPPPPHRVASTDVVVLLLLAGVYHSQKGPQPRSQLLFSTTITCIFRRLLL